MSRYEGRVLAVSERMFYNSSMDYDYRQMTVWDGGQVYSTGCSLDQKADASAEVVAEALAWYRQDLADRRVAQAEADSVEVAVGRLVTVVRGRKVARGTEGVVVWMGKGGYGTTRVKVEKDDGDTFFTDLTNLELAQAVAVPEADLRATAMQATPWWAEAVRV